MSDKISLELVVNSLVYIFTVPPFSVIQVKAINVTHDSVVLTWQLPTKDYSVDGYKILCQYNNRTEWDIVKNCNFQMYSIHLHLVGTCLIL